MSQSPAPIVVALGGNALSPDGREANIAQQFAQTRRTALGLLDLLTGDQPVVITHGNGPQVGNAVRRVELSAHEVYPLDLGICVADLQGGMGYMIAQCFTNVLRQHGVERVVAAILTSVLVDRDDPALADPTKPIGGHYSPQQAEERIKEYGWRMVEIPGRGFRRVVPSPTPREILEVGLIRRLVAAGEIVVAVGGGGIPVYRDEQGNLEGLEAVIDKDLASGLLARQLGASTFLILTQEPQVYLDFGKPSQRGLDRLTIEDARRYLAEGQFPRGSMGPKIRAAIDFLDAVTCPEPRVIIGAIEEISDAMAGRAGTTITRM
jgi:carbamate kinase